MGKELCNRDWTGHEEHSEVPRNLERILTMPTPPWEQIWLFSMSQIYKSSPCLGSRYALCSSCRDRACLSLLSGLGCSQVHSNRPMRSCLWGSCMDFMWVGCAAKLAHSRSGSGLQSHRVCSCSVILCKTDQNHGTARKGCSSSFSISIAAPGNLVWRISPLRKKKKNLHLLGI